MTTLQTISPSIMVMPNPSDIINNLHQKFVEYGRNAKVWQQKCILLLPEIDKQKIWLKKGFS